MSSSRPTVFKVIGAPGSGKTTRIVGNPELGIEGLFLDNSQRFNFEQQLLITYTRAAKDEAVNRLMKMMDGDYYKYEIEDRISTIHSLCYGNLRLRREKVTSGFDKREYLSKYDISYSMSGRDSDLASNKGRSTGNDIMGMYGWLKSNLKDISEYRDAPFDIQSNYDVEDILKGWEEYKQQESLYDFVDMIYDNIEWGRDQLQDAGYKDKSLENMEYFKYVRRNFGEEEKKEFRGKGPFPDTIALYVDEVQDLTPLQWSYYLMASIPVNEIYLGGDPNQSIYSFRGAKPTFMINESGRKEVLDKTYRLPKCIWDCCKEIIKEADVHASVDSVRPADRRGNLTFIDGKDIGYDYIINEALKYEGSTMILLRSRYHIDKLSTALNEKGIPYYPMHDSRNWSNEKKVLRFIDKVQRDFDQVTGDELSAVYDNIPEDQKAKNSSISADYYPLDYANKYFNFDLNRKEIIKNMDLKEYQKDFIYGFLMNNVPLIDENTLRVGTIHSAKGKEADTVIIGTDSTRKIMKNIEEETYNTDSEITDSERRVYFVGCSRAKKNLIMVENLTGSKNYLNLNDILPQTEPL